MTANAQTYNSITPARGIAVATNNPSVWYSLHEGTGTAVDDVFGLGPTLTINGTTPGSNWTKPGQYTPNGTDNYASGSATAHLNSVFGLASLATAGMVLVGFDYILPNASGSDQTFFYFGRDSTVGGGGWGVSIATTDAVAIRLRSASYVTANFQGLGSVVESSASLVSELYTLWMEGTNLRIERRNSADPGTVNNTQYDITAIGGALCGDTTDGLTLFTRRVGASGGSAWLGASGSGFSMGNFFAQKRPTFDSLIAGQAFADLLAAPREFPRALRG